MKVAEDSASVAFFHRVTKHPNDIPESPRFILIFNIFRNHDALKVDVIRQGDRILDSSFPGCLGDIHEKAIRNGSIASISKEIDHDRVRLR